MKNITYTYRDVISGILILVSFVLGFYFYAHFPDQVATHWNIQGEVNGYSPRAVAAFVFPGVMLAIYLMLTFLPYIDPRRERYEEFKRPYSIFKLLLVVFLTIIYCIVGLKGIGYPINISVVMPILIGLFFIGLGNYLGKIKPNWFVGIRTPWTISNEEVWNKTHRLGGKMFVIGGILIAITGFLPTLYRTSFFVSALVIIILVPVVYSYCIYRKLQK